MNLTRISRVRFSRLGIVRAGYAIHSALMEMDTIFLSEQNEVSKRWAILEDDGESAWLYVTERENEKPVADR